MHRSRRCVGTGRSNAVAVAVAVTVAVDLDLDLRGPSGAAEAADQTRRAPHMDVRRFPRGHDARSENPAGSADPVRSTGRAGGVCFFAPGFFAQAKKGGSRRHGAKAFDLAFAVTGDTQEQEQLAALAPSSALRAPSPASGRRAGTAPGAQTGGVLFAPGFFAQAKKGGSRRHGAKALDLDVAPAGRHQEQLAALAPSSGASRHLLPQAGEGLFTLFPAGG